MLRRVLLISAASGLLSLSVIAGASAADTESMIGTWKLNLAKSKFEGDPPLKSQVTTVTSAANGALHFSTDWVEAGDKAGHLEFTTSFSGKPDPTSGTDLYDSVTNAPMPKGGYKAVYRKAGKRVETEYMFPSKDGKSVRIVDSGKNEQGQPWKYTARFDKQ